jgi:feruloyl esterase
VASSSVAAGAFAPIGTPNAPSDRRFASLPAFCRVQATLTPTGDSAIRMELWLPITGWNERFQAVGGRALGGIIVYPAMADALRAGYATASTDTGHVGQGGAFALGHPEKLIDHGYRAVHEMTMASQRLVSEFYSRGARRSYFNGCSLGGRQGLAEAQRYPQDYDGIVAGDIAHNISDLYAARLRQHQFTHRTAQSALSDAALRVLNDAAVRACDQLDGVRDGVIENPQQCHFDPATLGCGAPGAPAECLSAEQVESARFVYAPVRHPGTGAIVSNGLMPGSEAGWRAILGPEPEVNSVEVYRYIVFKNPQWDWKTFDLAGALAAARSSQVSAVDAVDPDLHAFFARGGKLLMTHGWADPQTPPLNGLGYYSGVRSAVGPRASDVSLRMFMVPGMGHCSGGVGTDDFDAMDPLIAWVERGNAPERFEARRLVNGQAVRTRPLCAYPDVARWNGSGNTDDAASFVCAAP